MMQALPFFGKYWREAPPPLTYRGEPRVSPAFGPRKGEGDCRDDSPPPCGDGLGVGAPRAEITFKPTKSAA
jgi:hypothetical protein